MSRSAGDPSLALHTAIRQSRRTIDPHAFKIPRPAGAESTLTENVASPFHAEPRHDLNLDVSKPHATLLGTENGSGK